MFASARSVRGKKALQGWLLTSRVAGGIETFFNGIDNGMISCASAQVAGERGRDLLVVGRCGALEQGHRGHDLTGLAITALGHVQRDPLGVDGVGDLSVDALDRANVRAFGSSVALSLSRRPTWWPGPSTS